MILTENFLNKVQELFNQNPVRDEHQMLLSKDNQLYATLIKADANTIIIKIVNKTNPEKQELNDFIAKFDENQFALITDNFEKVTGKSLELINTLYEKGRYNEVHELIVLVLNAVIDDLKNKLPR